MKTNLVSTKPSDDKTVERNLEPPPNRVVTNPATTASPSDRPPQIQLNSAIGTLDLLSEMEMAELMACEAVIANDWENEVQVGMALIQVRDNKLWRNDYRDFKAYYRVRWAFSHTKVYRLVSAVGIYKNLVQMKDVPKPESEASLRPLIPLTPEQAQQVWQKAAALASGNPITERLVRRAVKELGLNPPKHESVQAKKSEQRKIVREGVDELVLLVGKHVGYDILQTKLEALSFNLSQLFRPSKPS